MFSLAIIATFAVTNVLGSNNIIDCTRDEDCECDDEVSEWVKENAPDLRVPSEQRERLAKKLKTSAHYPKESWFDDDSQAAFIFDKIWKDTGGSADEDSMLKCIDIVFFKMKQRGSSKFRSRSEVRDYIAAVFGRFHYWTIKFKRNIMDPNAIRFRKQVAAQISAMLLRPEDRKTTFRELMKEPTGSKSAVVLNLVKGSMKQHSRQTVANLVRRFLQALARLPDGLQTQGNICKRQLTK